MSKTLLLATQEEERMLVNELAGLPQFVEVCPVALVLGSRWIEMVAASVMMSRMVWFPRQSVNNGTYRGAIEVPPNRLVNALQLVGKDGRVYVKYTIAGRSGVELNEQRLAFIKTQLRANREDRLKNMRELVSIYLDAREKQRQKASAFTGAVELGKQYVRKEEAHAGIRKE